MVSEYARTSYACLGSSTLHVRKDTLSSIARNPLHSTAHHRIPTKRTPLRSAAVAHSPAAPSPGRSAPSRFIAIPRQSDSPSPSPSGTPQRSWPIPCSMKPYARLPRTFCRRTCLAARAMGTAEKARSVLSASGWMGSKLWGCGRGAAFCRGGRARGGLEWALVGLGRRG